MPDDGDLLIPLGEAEIKRHGTDATVVAIAGTVPLALAAAAELEASGISVEVVDPRTLVPLDAATILSSVERKPGGSSLPTQRIGRAVPPARSPRWSRRTGSGV